MRTIDDELKACAANALKNSLYRKMDELMSSVKAAAVGLGADPDAFYEVHAFGDAKEFELLNVWAKCSKKGLKGQEHTRGFRSMLEALKDEEAFEVWIDDVKVFEVRGGEWYYCEGE